MTPELAGYIDYGVLGLTIFALLVAIGWVVRTWRADLERMSTQYAAASEKAAGELKAEREAHQRTREAHLAELRNMMKMADSIDEMRIQLVRSSSDRNAA